MVLESLLLYFAMHHFAADLVFDKQFGCFCGVRVGLRIGRLFALNLQVILLIREFRVKFHVFRIIRV